MDANLIKGHLDLILLNLLEQDAKYGLEISKEVQERTGGYFDLRVGSLYPALHRLEQAGFLVGEFRAAPRGGNLVKYYRLTPEGQTELHNRRKDFETFTRTVQSLWS